MNKHKILLILPLFIICSIDSLISRYIIKNNPTCRYNPVITPNPLPHPTQLLKFRLSSMTASLWVGGRVWTLDMESRILRTRMHKIRLHHTCVIFKTLHPHVLFTVCCIYLLHVFLPSFTPSLRHHSDTDVAVLLSIYSHFLFSFYPCFTPKHDRLNKTRRLVLLLFLTVLHSFKIRITVGFFFSFCLTMLYKY